MKEGYIETTVQLPKEVYEKIDAMRAASKWRDYMEVGEYIECLLENLLISTYHGSYDAPIKEILP